MGYLEACKSTERVSISFDTSTQLVGRLEGHPACKTWGVGMMMVFSLTPLCMSYELVPPPQLLLQNTEWSDILLAAYLGYLLIKCCCSTYTLLLPPSIYAFIIFCSKSTLTSSAYCTCWKSVFLTSFSNNNCDIIIIIYLVSFLIYSMSNNVMTLKSESEVTQGHWKWYHRLRSTVITATSVSYGKNRNLIPL